MVSVEKVEYDETEKASLYVQKVEKLVGGRNQRRLGNSSKRVIPV